MITQTEVAQLETLKRANNDENSLFASFKKFSIQHFKACVRKGVMTDSEYYFAECMYQNLDSFNEAADLQEKCFFDMFKVFFDYGLFKGADNENFNIFKQLTLCWFSQEPDACENFLNYLNDRLQLFIHRPDEVTDIYHLIYEVYKVLNREDMKNQ